MTRTIPVVGSTANSPLNAATVAAVALTALAGAALGVMVVLPLNETVVFA